MKNSGPFKGIFLREWFPEQTKTIPRIILWTIIFLADTALVFWLGSLLGIDLLGISYRLTTLLIGLYLVIAFGLFSLEAFVYNKIMGL